MKDAPFLNVVLSVVLILAGGTLLYIGKPILLPIVTAVISVYLMEAASDAVGRLPLLRLMPQALLKTLVLLGFVLVVLVLAFVVTTTVQEIFAVAPIYQSNLDAFVERIATRYDQDRQELLKQIRAVSIDRMDFRSILLGVLGSFTNIGANVSLIMIYAAFIIADRGAFELKLQTMARDKARAAKTKGIMDDINRRISEYLVVKTFINVILGCISYAIMWFLDLDFALFWALVIGLMNYIPYVGTLIGVAFPVLLSLAQFGSLQLTLVLAVLLSAVQFVLGNIVEPRLIGKQLNLSPLVVLAALSIWTALWGIPGAILAIPLTSMFVIILSGFEMTKPLSLLFVDRIEDADVSSP